MTVVERTTAPGRIRDTVRMLARASRSTTLGLGVSGDSVRGIQLRRGKISWFAEQPVTESRPLPDVIDSLLADAISHAGRPRGVIAAIGPGSAQLRRLTGVPAVMPRLVADLVRENASRFFLRNGIPIITTDVERAADDGFWGAAIDEPVVTALREACARHRLRLLAVSPTSSLLRHATESDSFTWRDGEVSGTSRFIAGRLDSYRRHRGTTSPAELPVPLDVVAPLRRLGADGWRFADAYAAAVAGKNTNIAWRPEAARQETRNQRAKQVLSGALCAAAIVTAVVAPGLSAKQQERSAARELRVLEKRADEARALERQLAPLMRDVAAINEFAADARSVTVVLATLTNLIEPPASVAALRLDSAGGTMTVVAPSAASVLQQLETATGIDSLAIIGPVVPVIAPAPMPVGMPVAPAPAAPPAPRSERVTVRFQWVATERNAAP